MNFRDLVIGDYDELLVLWEKAGGIYKPNGRDAREKIASEDKKKKKTKSETPLSHSEQQIFRELLKRRKNEDQVEYWKRKKAMLNMEDKKSFVEKEIEARKKQEKSKAKEQQIADERQKRKLEAQMKKIKAAKYDATQKSENLNKKN